MDNVNKLIKFVELDKGKHRATQHMSGRLFPFYTRNPERVKFEDSFMEIVGIISRLTLGYSNEIVDIQDRYLSNVLSQIDAHSEINKTEIESLFAFDFSDINSPFMLKYFPSLNPKSQENQGKVLMAKYVIGLLKLQDNKEWVNYLSETQRHQTLYNQLIMNNLPSLDSDKSKNEIFIFFDQSDFLQLFNQDLSTLMENQNFFMSNIDLLISYYLFYYIIQQGYQIDMVKREPFKMWYAFDKERVSKGRNAFRFGYKLMLDKSNDFIINVNVVDYLNILIGDEKVYTLDQIVNDTSISSVLLPRLMQFNYEFANVEKFDYVAHTDIITQVKQLKQMLKETLHNELNSRYSKSFKEFSGLSFIRSRGRLGYILNASQEILLMFVGVIVGSNEKILLRDFFNGLEKRGMFFDTQSRREIVSYFEKINILEKLSDSGDAQYVKSIL